MAFKLRHLNRNGDKGHKTTAGFENQTRDVRNPPEALIGPLKCNVDTR